MAMIKKSRLPINILNRSFIKILVVPANNMADISKSGSDKKGSGSEKDGIPKVNDILSIFTSYSSPSGSGCKPCPPSKYDCRKYGHQLPLNNVTPCFDILPNIPTGIFRCTDGERLGYGAGKSCYYKCPEYFSYQHMSFYDIHLYLKKCRRPATKTGRKP